MKRFEIALIIKNTIKNSPERSRDANEESRNIRRFLGTGLRSFREVSFGEMSAGSFPEQQLVLEPSRPKVEQNSHLARENRKLLSS